MADPLFTPAIVGFAVSTLLTEVIKAAKMAYNCKDECNELAAKLENIMPLIVEVEKNEQKGNEACRKWLTHFKGLLEGAEAVTKECAQETVRGKAKRALKFWRWKKLPSRVLKVTRHIEEARANTDFVTLGILLSMKSPHLTPSFSFAKQDTPSLIIGVDEHFNKLQTSILQSSKKDIEASCFGLLGRGGAGKTMLAQMLNNDPNIKEQYGKDSVIWVTVGNDAKVGDLYERMGNSCILGSGVSERLKSIKNQEEQRTLLKNAFAEKKIFLILDDVWDTVCDHHEIMYWLDIAKAPGSATLITSRSKSVLLKAHAEVEVVLKLSEADSWKLFSSFAFDNAGSVSTIPENLARAVCEECQGLPLALKVIGSAMMDKVIVEEWESALSDLKQAIPILDSTVDTELFGRLQLSYNELKTDVTKICFLYFAAFPEDYEIPVDELFNIWVGEELFGPNLDGKEAQNKARAHLEILTKRSLIDWDGRADYAKVHDILRDLAIYIISKSKPGECAHECFFQSGKGLASFPNKELLKYLKRLAFVDCKIFQWPEDLHISQLKVCILQQITNLEEKMPLDFFINNSSIKLLDLSRALPSQAKLENIGKLQYLRHLNLSECMFLKRLPEDIGNLKNLTELDLRGCESLEELPKSISNLEGLKVLKMVGCKSLKRLPEDIGNLKCLTELDLRGCETLEELPKSISTLEGLKELQMGGCKSLKQLPEDIGNLKCLTELDLWGCKSLEELPKSISNLEGLKVLTMVGCKSLKQLPEDIGNLKCLTELDLLGCETLEELPKSISNLEGLKVLRMVGGRKHNKVDHQVQYVITRK
ncbi:hypothetical protein KC19_5G176000 [Ceratodon purpureus]|uniref:RPW8 domain-containing protein n=1 Tax=Ceratodon purpureus TaxID=3225 RepID=A0A8T0I471_CERPU|nr:hypothetical protein KC19_5G176000 [Ceratodon purpureus]